jgi:hypothetical protein
MFICIGINWLKNKRKSNTIDGYITIVENGAFKMSNLIKIEKKVEVKLEDEDEYYRLKISADYFIEIRACDLKKKLV